MWGSFFVTRARDQRCEPPPFASSAPVEDQDRLNDEEDEPSDDEPQRQAARGTDNPEESDPVGHPSTPGTQDRDRRRWALKHCACQVASS